ncbi:MAG: signal peptidase I [Oscillospiraceae bacterium]|nr:signal peptidase I [Oscillospiraceae bacterium]
MDDNKIEEHGAESDYIDIAGMIADNDAADGENAAEGAEEGSGDGGDKKESEKPGSKARLEIYDWLQCIVSTMITVILAFIFIGRQISVVGDSMLQTLHDNDKVLVTNVLYTPEYGDIVIIKAESFGETPLVKRVIATEGQEINIDFATRVVTVDGVALDEPYINEPTSVEGDFRGPVKVPEGCIFVMGDNRNRSTDSRFERVGFVDARNVLGKVHFVTMPGKDGNYGLRDWSRVGSVYRTTP